MKGRVSPVPDLQRVSPRLKERQADREEGSPGAAHRSTGIVRRLRLRQVPPVTAVRSWNFQHRMRLPPQGPSEVKWYHGFPVFTAG